MKSMISDKSKQWFRRWISPLAFVAVAAVACGGAATATPAPTATPQPESSSGIKPILATTLLRVGEQRLSFLLTTPKGLVKAPEAQVSAFPLGEGTPNEGKTAKFHLWPYGVRGAYSTNISFDQPGRWRLDITVDSDEITGETSIEVDVQQHVDVPEVGTVPPLSETKTLRTVSAIEELTTDFTPDVALYQMSVHEAIGNSRPSVIVFASPAFCTSPTCGPQVDTVSELREGHAGEADFIHVELYDNPHEIKGDLDLARYIEEVEQWGFSTIPDWFNESWVFILDAEGRIVHRYEGFVTLEELEEALLTVLASA